MRLCGGRPDGARDGRHVFGRVPTAAPHDLRTGAHEVCRILAHLLRRQVICREIAHHARQARIRLDPDRQTGMNSNDLVQLVRRKDIFSDHFR